MSSKTALRLLAALMVAGITGCSSSSSGVRADGGIDSAADASDDDAPDGGCPAERLCPGQCCPEYFVCAKDPDSGAPFCGIACSSSGICPMGSTCCDTRPTGGKQGVCMPSIGQTCICQTTPDCLSNACAPAVDSSGSFVGPYVCVPNDGQVNHGCNGPFVTCNEPAVCCVTDRAGNRFCSPPCTSDTTCGKGHCDTFDFSAAMCPGDTKACGL